MLLMEPKIARSFCWPCSCECCVSGSQGIEKTWNLSGSYIFWIWCSNVIRHKWKNFDSILISFIALVNIVELFFRPSLFSSLFHVFGRRFVVLYFYRIVCICIQNWFDHEWLDFGFFAEYALVCRRHACID